ncbi:uncharacterized protein TNCV_3109671 [Trichonephila clavipes]|nr:uncharacterized protein TNCV_3109671 [Trichonephila clavipes]
MLDVTKYPPSAHGFICRNCGGGDRGRVAIYRPFGEVSLSLNRTVTCMVLKANDRRTSCPCHDEFRGLRSDYVRLEDFGKRNKPGKRARRYFSQLSEFERGLIIGMKTAGWSTHRVPSQMDRSECAVKNCWEQWTREGTHAWKTGSGATMKTTRREDRRIVRQALVD